MESFKVNTKSITDKAQQLFEKLMASKYYPKSAKSGAPWPGWEEFEGHTPPDLAVYILWKTGDNRPVYVGEGQLGYRLGLHFHTKTWNSVQFLIDPEISNNTIEAQRMRKLLERLSIAVLEPKENHD